MSEGFINVAAVEDLPEGALLQAKAGDDVLCLANVGGQVYAVDNRCPHERWPLSNGTLDGEEIICPGHGMLFNVRNCTLNAYRVRPEDVVRYRVKVEDGAIWVARESASS